jgi:hypothetical protein
VPRLAERPESVDISLTKMSDDIAPDGVPVDAYCRTPARGDFQRVFSLLYLGLFDFASLIFVAFCELVADDLPPNADRGVSELQRAECVPDVRACPLAQDTRQLRRLPRAFVVAPDILAPAASVAGFDGYQLRQRLNVDQIQRQQLSDALRQEPGDDLRDVPLGLGLVVESHRHHVSVQKKDVPIPDAAVLKPERKYLGASRRLTTRNVNAEK